VKGADGKVKIDKRDERGRTVDVHALRHTFGTLLSRGGVAPRTAQAAMRHSTINLTMNTYTDPKLLDVAGALEALPSLPLSDSLQEERIAVRATETGQVLRSSGIPVIELRASIIIGSGSLSFEMIRALTERLPMMICPRWVSTPAQPSRLGQPVPR